MITSDWMSMNVPEKLSYGKYLARSACKSVKIMSSCKSDWKKTKNGNFLFVWKKLFVFLKGKHDEFSIFREKKYFLLCKFQLYIFFSFLVEYRTCGNCLPQFSTCLPQTDKKAVNNKSVIYIGVLFS